MDDQLQKKLNKPFMHFPTDYSVTGVGLGVYIVKGIVEAHGGTVIFSSQEDTGTIVMVTIPIPNDHELPSKSKSFTDLRIMFDKMLTDSKRVNKKSASK